MGLSRKARIVILGMLTTLMCLAELFFGFWSHSLALTADAFHMTSDVLALVIAWTAIHIGQKKVKSRDLTYGLQRAEVIGAFINGIFLIALCFTIVLSAIERFLMPEKITNPMLILYVGCAGLLVNICGLFLFHEHGHSHSHDHNEATGSHLNMRGVFLHVFGDALGSVGVIISSVIIRFTTWSWRWYVDPIMSLIIVVIITTTTIPLLKSAAKILLQGSPSHVEMEALMNDLSKVDNVISVHDFHVWQLSDHKIVASVHIQVDIGETSYHQVVNDIKNILHGKGIHSTTVQIESSDVNSCAYQCEETDCNARSCCTRETEAV